MCQLPIYSNIGPGVLTYIITHTPQKMLSCNPSERICTTAALTHAYFEEKPVQMTDAVAKKLASAKTVLPKQPVQDCTRVRRKRRRLVLPPEL